MIVALDLGTLTGYATIHEGVFASGTYDFKSRRFEGGGMRFLTFQRVLDQLHAMHPITEVAFEEVRRHAGTSAAHIYGGFLAVLTAWCENHIVPYVGVPVGTIKKFATGSGNASKEDVIRSVRDRWGHSPKDDNEADALALLHYRLAEIGA